MKVSCVQDKCQKLKMFTCGYIFIPSVQSVDGNDKILGKAFVKFLRLKGCNTRQSKI